MWLLSLLYKGERWWFRAFPCIIYQICPWYRGIQSDAVQRTTCTLIPWQEPLLPLTCSPRCIPDYFLGLLTHSPFTIRIPPALFRHRDVSVTSYRNLTKKLWSQIQLFKGNRDHWKTIRLFKFMSIVETTLIERKYNKGRKCESRYKWRGPAKTATSLIYGFDSRATHVLGLLGTMKGTVWVPLSISHREGLNLLVPIQPLVTWLLMFHTTILY